MRDKSADYFGPFASGSAVNRTVTALQRAFQLRNCADTVYATRTRPCLQYQIKRCTAPCVGRVTPEDYGAQVGAGAGVPVGQEPRIQAEMAKQMQAAAEALDFETAARYRDRIRALTATQAHQDINIEGIDDADVIACHQDGGSTCIQVFFFRGGSNYGNRAYFPSHDKNLELPEVLGAFIGQFYDNKPSPRLILVSHEPAEQELIAEALSLRAGRKVELVEPKRGDKSAPARPCAGQREGGAGPPAGGKRLAGPAAGGRRRGLRAGRHAGADRGLRQQPHPGHQRDRRHDRRRPGRADEEPATASSTSAPT